MGKIAAGHPSLARITCIEYPSGEYRERFGRKTNQKKDSSSDWQNLYISAPSLEGT